MRTPLLLFLLLAVGALPAAAATQGTFELKTARVAIHGELRLKAAHVAIRSGLGLRAARIAAQRKRGLTAARVVVGPGLPPRADRDGDGLDNRTELHQSKTDPRKFDTDGDSFGDGVEVAAGSNPRSAASVPAPLPPDSTAADPPQVSSPTPPDQPEPPVEEPPVEEPPVEEPPEPDTTAPDTTIDSGPSGTTTSTGASFGFTADEAGSSFECALDSSSWNTCASPRSYGGLGIGAHTFSVRATDVAGNTDASPAIWSWTVEVPPDTIPPNTSIVSGPPSTTTSTSASFTFSSSESGSTYQCSLDSTTLSSCTSPKGYSDLGVGPHTFSVKATDSAGNTDASPATRSWTVAEPEPPVDCTTSLSAGANVADAIEGAAGGTVICLAPGNYGRITLDGAHKSPVVTIRSGSEGRATVNGITLTDPSGLRFAALDITGGTTVTPSGSNLQFLDNDITGVAGIYLFGDYRIGEQISNVLIEGNNIHDIDYTGSQETGYGYGIEGVGEVRNMTIRENTIKSPASDYIQSASPINWVVDRNTFLGPSLLAEHEDHQDLWQIFGGGEDVTFTNNVARNTQTQESLLFQEGAFRNVDIENNLFDHDSRGYTCQIYQSTGLVFRNNTIVGSHWGCLFRDLASSPPGSGYEVDHNIFADTEASVDISEEGRADDWGVYDYNVSSDNSAEGLHSVRNWSPSWSDTTNYQPLGLPFAAGFSP